MGAAGRREGRSSVDSEPGAGKADRSFIQSGADNSCGAEGMEEAGVGRIVEAGALAVAETVGSALLEGKEVAGGRSLEGNSEMAGREAEGGWGRCEAAALEEDGLRGGGEAMAAAAAEAGAGLERVVDSGLGEKIVFNKEPTRSPRLGG